MIFSSFLSFSSVRIINKSISISPPFSVLCEFQTFVIELDNFISQVFLAFFLLTFPISIFYNFYLFGIVMMMNDVLIPFIWLFNQNFHCFMLIVNCWQEMWKNENFAVFKAFVKRFCQAFDDFSFLNFKKYQFCLFEPSKIDGKIWKPNSSEGKTPQLNLKS